MRDRKLLFAASVLGVTLSLIICFAIGEVAIRLVHLIRDGIAFTETPSGQVGAIVLDPRLGWRATDWYTQDLVETTAGGVAYAVHRSQGAYGFRLYGDGSMASAAILSPPRSPHDHVLRWAQFQGKQDTRTVSVRIMLYPVGYR